MIALWPKGGFRPAGKRLRFAPKTYGNARSHNELFVKFPHKEYIKKAEKASLSCTNIQYKKETHENRMCAVIEFRRNMLGYGKKLIFMREK